MTAGPAASGPGPGLTRQVTRAEDVLAAAPRGCSTAATSTRCSRLLERDPVADVFVASRVQSAGLDREPARRRRSGASASAAGSSRSATPAPTSSRCRPDPRRCAPSPTGPADRAGAARRSSARPTAVAALWQLLTPSWGRGAGRPRAPAAAGARRAAGRRRPTRACGRCGRDEVDIAAAGLHRDVHRGDRRLAARRRRRSALPGPRRRAGRPRAARSPASTTAGSSSRPRSARRRRGSARCRACGSTPELRGRGLSVAGTAAVGGPGAGARRAGGQPVRQRLQRRRPPCLRPRGLPPGGHVHQRPVLRPVHPGPNPWDRCWSRPGRARARLRPPPTLDERTPVTLQLKPGTTWDEVYARARSRRPGGVRRRPHPQPARRRVAAQRRRPASTSTRSTARRSRARRGSTHDEAAQAVVHAARRARARGPRSTSTSARAGCSRRSTSWREHRDTLALLLVWEIGKPWKLACADVDRGARRRALVPRRDRAPARRAAPPLPGPVSNIASWNYPMSVQVHAELVQCLAGNAVVAKTPSQGGFHTLTLAHAFMKRAGLPVTLLSGVGSQLGDVLIRSEEIGCLAFVGGRANGRKAATVAGRHRQAALPRAGGPERLGRLGLLRSGTSSPPTSRKGFEYAQAALHRLPALRRAARADARSSSRCTCRSCTGPALRPPARGREPRRPAARPALRPADQRRPRPPTCVAQYDEAVTGGGIPLYRGSLGGGRFLDGQDTSRLRRAGLRARAAAVAGRCTTPSRSARSTRSSWSTPRPSCSRR